MTSRLEWRRDTPEVPKDPASGVRGADDALVDGRYRVLDLLGHGGLGVVYRAEDVWLDRPVALKLLQPASARDVETIEAFKKEARVLAHVRHDNVVQVYAFGPDRTSFYLAMEYIEGKNLDRIIEEHAATGAHVAIERALEIVRHIGRGLAAVHARSIVHRDVKPSNIVIEDATQRPVLVDFGLARRRSGSSPKLSSVGGTPSYMAPEQATDATGERITARSDLYSLACTAFELLTGRPVFTGTSAFAVLAAHLKEPPPRISSIRPELATLDAPFQRALAKEPGDRQESCAAFVEELTAAARRLAFAPRTSARAFPDAPTIRVVIWERDQEFRRQIVRLVDSALTSPGDAAEIECVATAAEFTATLAREPAQLVVIDDESASAAAESAVRALRGTSRGKAVEVLVLNRDWNVAPQRLAHLTATELPKPINPQVVRAVLARMAARIAERRSAG